MNAFTLLSLSVLLSAPVLAQDLCSANLQRLADQTVGTPLGDPLEQQFEALRKAAAQAEAAGELETCIARSAQALQLLERSNKTDGGG